MIVSNATMEGNRRRRSMGFRGLCFTSKILLLELQPWHENGITRVGEVAMNSISYRSGRRGDRSQVQILSPRPPSNESDEIFFGDCFNGFLHSIQIPVRAGTV